MMNCKINSLIFQELFSLNLPLKVIRLSVALNFSLIFSALNIQQKLLHKSLSIYQMLKLEAHGDDCLSEKESQQVRILRNSLFSRWCSGMKKNSYNLNKFSENMLHQSDLNRRRSQNVRRLRSILKYIKHRI